MKKSVVVLIVVVSTILSSCSFYTCPTYAKVDKKTSTKTEQKL